MTINGQIIFHPEICFEDLNKNKNIQKEAGSIFEMLCYGNIQKNFTIKQLLFITNEINDNLDCDSFKIKYENECKKDLSELLNEFPENQLLSEHVKKIKECLENNSEEMNVVKELNNQFIVYKDEIEDYKDMYSSLNDNKTMLVSEIERYDNKYPFEKRRRNEISKKK